MIVTDGKLDKLNVPSNAGHNWSGSIVFYANGKTKRRPKWKSYKYEHTISFGLVRKRAHHVAKMLNVYAPTYCKQPTGCMGQLEWQWNEIKL